MKQLKLFIFFLSITRTYAANISVSFGGYALESKVNNQTSSISNLGAYRLQYENELNKYFQFFISYNLLIENVFTGDKSFGPSIGISYYPQGSQTISESKNDNLYVKKSKIFNYYFLGSFNQRQFQSIRSNYSGISIGAGVEAPLKKVIVFTDIQNAFLEGASNGRANETTINIGVRFPYGN